MRIAQWIISVFLSVGSEKASEGWSQSTAQTDCPVIPQSAFQRNVLSDQAKKWITSQDLQAQQIEQS